MARSGYSLEASCAPESCPRQRELRHSRCHTLGKGEPVRGCERLAGGQRNRQRIALFTADAELVVKVRPRRPARLPDVADHFSLRHARAIAHLRRESRQVRVEGRERALVPQFDHVAVAVLPAGERHLGIAGGAHGRACGRSVVDALVRPPILHDRVEARVREARGHARELHRRTQERLAQRRAVIGEVILAAIVAAPEQRPDRPAPVRELGGDDATRADRFAVDVPHFIDDRKTVAAPQVLIEIDVAGEDIGHLQRHRVRQARRVGSAEQ